MNSTVRFGLIQMKVEADIFDKAVRKQNVQRAVEQMTSFLEQNENVDCVVLSEEFYAGAGYGPISLPDTIDTVKEEVFKVFGPIAKKYNVYIIGEISAKLNVAEFKGNNVGFVIDRNGEVAGYQERFHQNPSEEAYSARATEYKIFELDFGKVGLLLGVDLLFPEVARNFVLKGAEILISPVLCPGIKMSEGENQYPNCLITNCAVARALENQVFLVMVNSVGKFAHVDLDLFGESLVAGPKGLIKKLGDEEESALVEVNLNDKMDALRSYDLMEMRYPSACIFDEVEKAEGSSEFDMFGCNNCDGCC